MNLKSKGARRTLSFVCSTAVIAAGASLFAAPASAVGVTLAYGPTPTSATIANFDPMTSTAETSYGLKVTGAGSTDADPLRMSVLTGPSNASAAVYAQRVYANNGPAASPVGAALAAAANDIKASGTSGSTTLNLTGVATAPAADLDEYILRIGDSAPYQYAKVSSGGATATLVLEQALTSSVTGVAIKSMGTATTGVSTGVPVTGTATGTTTLTTTAGGAYTAPAADLGGYVLRIGAAAPYQYATVASGGTTATLTMDRVIAAVSGAALAAVNTKESAAGVVTGLGATVSGALGATSLTLATGLTGDVSHHVLRIGNVAPYQYVVVTNTSDTTGLTAISIDRPLTVAVSNVTVWDFGANTPTGTTNRISVATYVGSSGKIPAYSSADADNIFLSASYPGSYTLRFYKDRNGNQNYDSDQDDATPVFTLAVKDVNGTTTDTSDDLASVLSVVSSTNVGQAITPTVSLGGLTSVDTRGSISGIGVLGAKIAAVSTITFTPSTTGIGAGAGASSFDGTSIYETSALSSAAGTATTTFTIGSNITRTASTIFGASTVNSVDEDVTDVSGFVKDAAGTAARAVNVKVGRADVTYTALVKDAAATPAVVSGATVYFTVTSGTNTPVLTSNGTTVSTAGNTKVFSAISNSSGIATLIVTSGTTTAGTTYTVGTESNGKTGDTLTATYAAAAAASIDNTNSEASLLATPGDSVTLTGRLLDQFDGAYTPSGAAPMQVAVRMPAGGAVAGQATFTGSAFSYIYTPTTAPTAGTSTSWDFNYDPAGLNLNGPDSAINWASADPAASVTITGPAAAASVTQQKATVTPTAGTAVTGTVLNSTSGLMAFKSVTLTGSDGVYFSNAATPTTNTTDDLKTSVVVASNASGVYTGYAFFTKIGTATLTVTSGTATKSVDVAVTQAADPYKVIAIDASVEPGSNSVITGEVKNGFGFPVAGVTVDLSLGASTIAALNNTTVTTSTDGVWSTTLTGASAGSGTATLTATLSGKTANPVPHADWLANAGLTIDTGSFQDTATITVNAATNDVTLSGPASRLGAGSVTLTGTARANSTVEILGRPSGSAGGLVLYGSTTADASGVFQSSQYVSTNTVFQARVTISGTSHYSPMISVVVIPKKATVTFKAQPIGRGLTRIWINGAPNAKARTSLYVNGRYIKSWTSNAWGDSYITLKTSRGWKGIAITYAPSGYVKGSRWMRVYVR